MSRLSSQVNEKGSEAAAATGLVIELRTSVLPVEFKADHSFVFGIFYKNQFLFLGKYA